MNLRHLPYSLSTKQKMTIAFLSVSLFSVLLMAFFSQYYYGKSTKEDFYAVSQDASLRLNHQMELYLQQLTQATFTLIAGPGVSRLAPEGPRSQSDLIQKWLRHEQQFSRADIVEIEDTLRRYVALNYSEIVGMFLMSDDRQIISMAGTSMTSGKVYENEPWYRKLTPGVKILPTHITKYPQMSGVPVVTIVIPIYNTLDAELIGSLVIDIKLKQIENILGRSTLGKTGYFFIVGSDGTIVYHPNPAYLGLPRSQTDLSVLSLAESTSVQEWLGKKVLLVHNYSEATNWTVVALVPYEEMANGLTIARNSTFLVVFILSLCIICVVPLLSNLFISPIRKLKYYMQQVELGDLSVRADVYPGQDELQSLNNSFNKMTRQLKELVDTVSDLKLKEVHIQLRQKEAIIQALQNQINPHLLYNTLDIIKSIAYLENVPAVEVISRNLADVYRYTAKIPDLEVTLGEELIHLNKYLQIVHVRFPRYFRSHLNVHEKYINCRIVKLTLQPIIENAVKYAIEPLGGKGVIIVNAYHEADVLIIEIVDNGPGIPEERLQDMLANLSYITEHANDRFVTQESLGIANVHARLVLQYGHDFGLTVSSFPGRSTIVSIRVPMREIQSEAAAGTLPIAQGK